MTTRVTPSTVTSREYSTAEAPVELRGQTR